MPVTPDQAGPYAPASVIIDLIERHRNKGLPTPVNADVLARAGVSSSLSSRTLQALVVMDLITPDGSPTQAMEGMRLAPEPEYRTRMTEWLNSAYADALQFVDPSSDGEGAIRDAFRKYNPVGQQSRMVTLFMGLFRYAGIAPEKTPTGGAARKKPQGTVMAKPKKAPAEKPTAAAMQGNVGAGEKPTADTQNQPPDYRAALLAKFPDFDPAWPNDIKAKWFEGFEQFMKGVSPK